MNCEDTIYLILKNSNSGIYTIYDSLVSSLFYQILSYDGSNLIKIISRSDDRCKLCSNYNNGRCMVFKEEDLIFEDSRSLKLFSPELKIGDFIDVKTILSYNFKNIY